MSASSRLNIVVSYRGSPQMRGWETGASLARALRRLGHRVYEYGNVYRSRERLDSSPLDFSPDLWVYMECNDEEPQYTEVAQFQDCIKCYWDFDTEMHVLRSVNLIEHLDCGAVFCANHRYIDVLRVARRPVVYLPYAVDPDLHTSYDGEPQEFDVGLIGSPYPQRIRLVEHLRQYGLNAQLVTSVYGEEMIRTLKSFRICLNYLVGGGRGLLNIRFWEALGCAIPLAQDMDNGIDEVARNAPLPIATYSSDDECVALVRRMLADYQAAQAHARRWHSFVLEHHTYEDRARLLLRVVMQSDIKPVPPSVRSRLAVMGLRAQDHVPTLRHAAGLLNRLVRGEQNSW